MKFSDCCLRVVRSLSVKWLVYALGLMAPLHVDAVSQPNVVILLADDLGWKDVGYHGAAINTPHIDRLAQQGVQLERYYVQPTCSPTRAALMTGQSVLRTGVTKPIEKSLKKSLPLSLKLLPDYFRDAGYQTWLSGKWHLGHTTRAQLPMARGFDQTYGNMLGGVGYWDHIHGGGLDWHRNGDALREKGYGTRLVAEESVRMIKSRNHDKPFFLYASFTAPHLPNEAPQETIARYAAIEDPNRRVHAAMVDELDQAIGRILKTLEAEGLTEDTLVWFMSDNGGLNPEANSPKLRSKVDTLVDWFGKPLPLDFLEFVRSNVQDGGSDNGPYRRGKGSVYEGGVLVPSVLAWPAHVSPRRIEQRITVQDVLPTLAEVAGIDLPADHDLDGRSQWQVMSTGVAPPPADYIVSGPHAKAYYSGAWKLVLGNDEKVELYNLSTDPFEQNNVASSGPERVHELMEKLESAHRGESIHDTGLWEFLLDPAAWGGEETRLPWADTVIE